MNKSNGKKIEEPVFDELDEKIYHAFIELGWLIPQTEEDVERAEKALEEVECPSLPTELADSSKVLERIRKNFNQVTRGVDAEQISNIKPYLGYVSDETGLPPSKIEQEIELSTDFLIQVTEGSEVV